MTPCVHTVVQKTSKWTADTELSPVSVSIEKQCNCEEIEKGSFKVTKLIIAKLVKKVLAKLKRARK